MKLFSGKVVQGDGVGKKLGFPTANLDLNVNETGLGNAVYAAYTVLAGQKYQAALAIDVNLNKVEVYLIDYAGGNFYGEEIEVEVLEKVSEMEELKSEDELSTKIIRDVERIRDVFLK